MLDSTNISVYAMQYCIDAATQLNSTQLSSAHIWTEIKACGGQLNVRTLQLVYAIPFQLILIRMESREVHGSFDGRDTPLIWMVLIFQQNETTILYYFLHTKWNGKLSITVLMLTIYFYRVILSMTIFFGRFHHPAI